MEKNKILIQNAMLPSMEVSDLLIEGNRISKIGHIAPAETDPDAEVIDATGCALLPGFANLHTHAAMTFFRGYGGDMALMDWLNKMIWPVEAHMTPEEVYIGAKYACLEMIKTGTTLFLDMYSFPEGTAKAVEESGLRANLSYTLFDRWDPVRARKDKENLDRYLRLFETFSDRVRLSVGPHAIYTVSGEILRYAADFARANDLLVHLHLSETYTEWKECVEKYGTTPVRYLDRLGVLGPNLILAHSLWMDSEELRILAGHGCSVAHNPASNMKLASGCKFRYEEMRRLGIRVGIGTDGVSSSNTLDMTTAMRLASFLAKSWSGDPKAAPADSIYNSATATGYEILREPGGKVAEGSLADLILVDLTVPEMTPCHDLISNMVYAASGAFVLTTIVDGKILMRDRKVEGEEALREEFLQASARLFAKAQQ